VRLDLNADEDFFCQTTAKFLDEHASTPEIRRLRESAAGYDPEYWRRGAELGWTSFLVPEDAGGGSITQRGLADLTLVAHEFGRHAAPGPLLPTNVVAGAMANHDGRHELLPQLLAGEAVCSWAYMEPPPEGGLGKVTLEIRVSDGQVILNGVKAPVESAAQASHFLVTGRTADNLTQVIVPADAPGVSVIPMKSVDLTRRFSTVQFDDVRIPVGAALGEVGAAATAVDGQLHQALVILAAEAVGAIQRAFDITLAWAFDRYTFGRPLASYQALKHRFADMKTWLEASHAISDAAAVAVAERRPDAAKLASIALAYVGQYGSDLMQNCIQLHGGIGLTFDHDLHLFFRRHTLNRTLFGTPADHRQRIACLAEQELSR
jgi:alkylation response protein AidB-like acyl-CoA dehydrogenase